MKYPIGKALRLSGSRGLSIAEKCHSPPRRSGSVKTCAMRNPMKKLPKFLFLSLGASGIIALTACSTTSGENQHASPNIHIQSFDSSHAKIKSVKVNAYRDRTVISGKVERIRGVRGPVFGHLDLRILSAAQETIYQGTGSHKTSPVIPQLARFSLQIPAHIEENSTITISHHFQDWNDTCQG